MIINVQAFNAKGQDARRICEELDDFQSRRPIDVIKRNRPILGRYLKQIKITSMFIANKYNICLKY